MKTYALDGVEEKETVEHRAKVNYGSPMSMSRSVGHGSGASR